MRAMDADRSSTESCAANDRRVKLVVLTARGVRTKEELLQEFRTAPPELLALDRSDLEALEELLQKLQSGATPGATRTKPSGALQGC
jgi:hypothetical protein